MFLSLLYTILTILPSLLSVAITEEIFLSLLILVGITLLIFSIVKNKVNWDKVLLPISTALMLFPIIEFSYCLLIGKESFSTGSLALFLIPCLIFLSLEALLFTKVFSYPNNGVVKLWIVWRFILPIQSDYPKNSSCFKSTHSNFLLLHYCWWWPCWRTNRSIYNLVSFFYADFTNGSSDRIRYSSIFIYVQFVSPKQ